MKHTEELNELIHCPMLKFGLVATGDAINIITGVRQGCIISPGRYLALHITVMYPSSEDDEYVMYRSEKNNETCMLRLVKIGGSPDFISGIEMHTQALQPMYFELPVVRQIVIRHIFENISKQVSEDSKKQLWIRSQDLDTFINSIVVPAAYSQYSDTVTVCDTVYISNPDTCITEKLMELRRIQADDLPGIVLREYYDINNDILKPIVYS